MKVLLDEGLDYRLRHQQPPPSMLVLVLEVGSRALRDLRECIPQIARVLASAIEPRYYGIEQPEHD